LETEHERQYSIAFKLGNNNSNNNVNGEDGWSLPEQAMEISHPRKEGMFYLRTRHILPLDSAFLCTGAEMSVALHPISLRSILMLSFHQNLSVSSGLFLSGFPTKTLSAFLTPICATCPAAHFILHDLIILIIFGEECNYEAPHYAIFSSLLLLPFSKVHMFPSALCCQTPSISVHAIVLHPYKIRQNCSFLYFNLHVFR
jgi:hypothetical protein